MKKIAKVISVVMVAVMILGMFSVMASAADPAKGSITITNASMGQTYAVYKLFDAKVAGNGPIVYVGEIPEALSAYFKKDANGYILPVKEGHLSDQAINAITAWAATQTPTKSEKATADTLTFTDLDYGYYVVTSTLGAVVSIDSTNPNAEVKDKNTSDWSIRKAVDDENVYIGQTVNYTIGALTANFFYNAETGKTQKVTKYVFHDTLPSFLDNVTVNAIKILDSTGTNVLKDLEVQQFDQTTKEITIPWVDADGNHLYDAGVIVRIYYSATVTQAAVIDGDGNKNELTVSVYVKDEDSDEEYKKEEKKDSDIFYTYALALKKTDNSGNALVGAIFNIYGLTVSGEMGNYTVVSYDAEAAANKVPGTNLITDNEGNLIIKGLASDAPVTLHEVQAPDGYNLLAADLPLTPQVVNTTVTSWETITYYDAEGNVTQEQTETYTKVIDYTEALKAIVIKVVNVPGAELPETGGMGTALFIFFGAMTAVAAAVVLVARKKTAGYR